MRFDFLQAAGNVAISKEFYKSGEEIETKPYPFIKNFNSHTKKLDTPEALFEELKQNAAVGNVVLKGTLTSDLNNESRAGKTKSTTPTSWILLDLDFEDGFTSIDHFLASLDPALADVTYIFQHSSSAGIKYTHGIRGHVFILLDKPTSPMLIKEWLIKKNFETPQLNARIELASNSLTLKYPLDISTCQNDKLIFIADPICNGITDPLKGNRIELHKKSNDFAKIHFTADAAINRNNIDDKINELRKARGLKKRTPKYRSTANGEILTNPEEAIITGIKKERGFVYLNLNNGDSWAYYHPENNPNILYNFKGEPAVRIKDIAPAYWYSIANQEQKQQEEKPIVFRDRETDTYWNGIYYPDDNSLDIYPVSSTQRIADFLAQYGEHRPEYIEDWDLVFDPTTNEVINYHNKWVNKFTPSKYMRLKADYTAQIPDTIKRVITSVCGDDQESIDHFLNWFAYIFQTRKKTGTGFIFHGRTGTGKGVLFERIIKPLLGEKYVNELILDNLEDQFNQYLETSLILWIDEFNASDSKSAGAIMNKLKNLVTENTVTVRGMRKNPKQCKVYNNIIIASNHADPIPMDPNDRRFNVTPAQENMIQLDEDDIIQIKSELETFAKYLAAYNVDRKKVSKPMENEAKQKMITAGMSSHDAFFDALRTGNLVYFTQYLRDKAPLSLDNTYIEFERAVKRWTAVTNQNKTVLLTREELLSTYAYLQHAQRMSPTKFARMCSINRMPLRRYKADATTYTNGIKVKFVAAPDIEEIEQITKPNIIEVKP